MIYCSSNNFRGNLGNQCMRVMSLMGLAKKYKVDWAIPHWKYSMYFDNYIPQMPHPVSCFIRIIEPHFHYIPEFWDKQNWGNDIDLDGFFQSPKYWSERLVFNHDYIDELRRRHDFGNNPIAISIRRGDFVGHKCYFQIQNKYYISALYNFFPDYNERDIFIFSDDLLFCMNHFNLTKRTFFIDKSDIEQLAIMSLCSDHIISNSTFSYMGAYLSNGSGMVIRPIKNFDNEYSKRNSEKDYWVENWIPYDETKTNVD